MYAFATTSSTMFLQVEDKGKVLERGPEQLDVGDVCEQPPLLRLLLH